MNLSHFLRQAGRRLGGEVAVAHGEARTTWAELDRRVDAAAAGLTARGVAKGDRVLVQSRNGREMIEAMFACFRIGAVYVPANFRQTPEEVGGLCQTAGATAMVCGSMFPGHAAAAQAAAPGLALLAIGEAPFAPSWDAMVTAHAGATVPDAAVEHDDPCWFFFTSGTTGRPKASVLTHGQMAFVVNNHLCGPHGRHHAPADASLVLAPLSHGAGVHLPRAGGAVASKASCRRASGSTPRTRGRWWREWRVTNMFTVPTIVKLLTEHPSVDRHDHSSPCAR